MLSIGSVVRLKDGSQELMILSRAPLIEELIANSGLITVLVSSQLAWI